MKEHNDGSAPCEHGDYIEVTSIEHRMVRRCRCLVCGREWSEAAESYVFPGWAAVAGSETSVQEER